MISIIRKFFLSILFISFLLLSSCGTLIKFKQINKPVSNKIDYSIVGLDSIGLVLFVIPGVAAFSIDYLTGTIFLPADGTIQTSNLDSKSLQKILKKHNIKINLKKLKLAQNMGGVR